MDDLDSQLPFHILGSGMLVAGGGVASVTAYLGTPGAVFSPAIHVAPGLHPFCTLLGPVESLGWAVGMAIPLAAPVVRRAYRRLDLTFVFKRDVI